MNKKVLATVTARGESKRIPKKSIVPILGRPSMVWVIEALQKSKRVNRIIVDTDSEEIAEIGRGAGAEIPFLRPKELARDSSTHLEVLKHELEFLKKKERYWPDAVVLVQPTNPLVEPEDIDRAVELLLKDNLDSVETIFEVPTIFHPYRVRTIDTQGFTRFFMPNERKVAIQSGIWPKIYAVDAVYCFKPETLYTYGTIQGERSKSVIVPREQTSDIDEPIDVLTTEAVLKHRHQRKN